MAGTSLFRRVAVMTCATFAAFIALGLAGCQSTNRSAVASLPAPSFNGPTIASAQGTVAAPAPITPRATGRITGPKDWTAKAPPRAWRWIVVHHSATPGGSAALFNQMHKAKGWDEMGYHFVIGNGTNSGNGAVEVGTRWPKQKWGAHAKTADNRYNEYGIGICLVGNFDLERPTPAQMKSLNQLVAYLMKTYRVPADRVIGHGDTKATDCPGKFMSIAQVRRTAIQTLADAGESSDLAGDVADPILAPDAVAASATQEPIAPPAE